MLHLVRRARAMAATNSPTTVQTATLSRRAFLFRFRLVWVPGAVGHPSSFAARRSHTTCPRLVLARWQTLGLSTECLHSLRTPAIWI